MSNKLDHSFIFMENDSLDKSIQDIEKQLNSIGKFDERKLEDFFKQNYSEIWAALSNEEKQVRLKKICDFLNDPLKREEIVKALEASKKYEQVKFNIGILFLGVMLGISGNLIANLLDRHLINSGLSYDIFVVVLFFFSLWYIYREFVKKPGEKMELNKIVKDLFAILEKGVYKGK